MNIIDQWIAKLRTDAPDTFIKETFFDVDMFSDRRNCKACAIGKLYQLLPYDKFQNGNSMLCMASIRDDYKIDIHASRNDATIFGIITVMNDEGKTGPEIADWIEANRAMFYESAT